MGTKGKKYGNMKPSKEGNAKRKKIKPRKRKKNGSVTHANIDIDYTGIGRTPFL